MQETSSTRNTYSVQIESLSIALKHAKMASYIDIGFYKDKMVLVAIDKAQMGVLRYTLPIESLTYQYPAYVNINLVDVVKIIDSYEFGTRLIIEVDSTQGLLYLRAECGQMFTLCCNYGEHSREIVELDLDEQDPQRELSFEILVKDMRDLLRGLNEKDERVQFTLTADFKSLMLKSTNSLQRQYVSRPIVLNNLEGTPTEFFKRVYLPLNASVFLAKSGINDKLNLAFHRYYLIISLTQSTGVTLKLYLSVAE